MGVKHVGDDSPCANAGASRFIAPTIVGTPRGRGVTGDALGLSVSPYINAGSLESQRHAKLLAGRLSPLIFSVMDQFTQSLP